MAESSPWGTVQFKHQYARGITSVSTAGHGGLRISKGIAKELPPAALKAAIQYGNYFYFEEDCAWAVPCHVNLFVFTALANDFITRVNPNGPKKTHEDFRKRVTDTIATYYPELL